MLDTELSKSITEQFSIVLYIATRLLCLSQRRQQDKNIATLNFIMELESQLAPGEPDSSPGFCVIFLPCIFPSILPRQFLQHELAASKQISKQMKAEKQALNI